LALENKDVIFKYNKKIKVMEIRISIVIQSMLNDAMVEVHHQELMEEGQERLRFVKYLVNMFPDTDKKMNVDVVYKQFKLGDNK
jgi:hypothetical protein